MFNSINQLFNSMSHLQKQRDKLKQTKQLIVIKKNSDIQIDQEMKKSKTEKITEQDSEQKARHDKKATKQKKKNKKENSQQKQHFDERGQNVFKKNDQIQQRNKQDHHIGNNNNTNKKTVTTTKPSTSAQIDPLIQQMSLLTFTPQLTPNQPQCQLINTNLQQLTINLYQTMIMKPSYITNTIELAKQELLTPKQYFAIDYTNKLLLIKELLKENSLVKYGKFVRMIDEEVERVERLVLRCMEEVTLYEDVLKDLKKANVEWEVSEQ